MLEFLNKNHKFPQSAKSKNEKIQRYLQTNSNITKLNKIKKCEILT